MLPVIALVGRPNVGKSTLFNKLTRTRDALVDNQPGVTRDRLYGKGKVGNKRYLVVDTGGIESEQGDFTDLVKQQVDQVIEEAQVVLFLVDGLSGIVPQDSDIATQLRQSERQVHVIVNKTEGVEDYLAVSEFQELALGEPLAISAKRGDGIEELVEVILADHHSDEDEQDDSIPRIAIVGRPNVGKSTLDQQAGRRTTGDRE